MKVKKLETSGDEFVWHVETDKSPNEFRTRRSVSRAVKPMTMFTWLMI